MKNQYRREMERLGPRQEELERLYETIEGGTVMKRKMWIGCRAAAAIAACAVLTITAAAAAAPTVWEALKTQLGVFAPYAQTVEGAVDTHQGIELQVLSALSDDMEAQVYFALRDVEQDRLDDCLRLTGELTAGEEREDAPDLPVSTLNDGSTRYFKLVSYDSETKVALFFARIGYYEEARPLRDAKLSLTGLSTRLGAMYSNKTSVSCASVTGTALKSLPLGKGDKVTLRPGDVAGLPYNNSVLPSRKVVLAPGQTPMAIEGTEDMRVSSMGFASDGRFHIRLEFAEGVSLGNRQNPDGTAEPNVLYSNLWDGAGGDARLYTFQETLVDGGVDILFPLVTVDDLEELQSYKAGFYGEYLRPGTDVEGEWSAEFELDYYPSATLDWTGELAGRQVEKVTVSPLSVTMTSNDTGMFSGSPLYAVMKDGTTVEAQPGTGSYNNLDAMVHAGMMEEGEGYRAFNTWKFAEPVKVEDIVSLTLQGETIPVN